MTRKGPHRGCILLFHAIGCPDWKPDDGVSWEEYDRRREESRLEWKRRRAQVRERRKGACA